METVGEGDGEKEDSAANNTSCECALFMDGLPSDFSTNPQLAALASLLESEDDKEDNGQKQLVVLRRPLRQPQAGGGKARSARHCLRKQTNFSPYRLPVKRESKHPTIGETELFLKMWKF